MIEMEEDGIDAKFKQIFEYIQHGKYFQFGIMMIKLIGTNCCILFFDTFCNAAKHNKTHI